MESLDSPRRIDESTQSTNFSSLGGGGSLTCSVDDLGNGYCWGLFEGVINESPSDLLRVMDNTLVYKSPYMYTL